MRASMAVIMSHDSHNHNIFQPNFSTAAPPSRPGRAAQVNLQPAAAAAVQSWQWYWLSLADWLAQSQ